MKESRVSTILFNEWICLTSEHEKTLARIGKQVYQGFAKGKIADESTLEICRRISDTFKQAREARLAMEDDLRRETFGEENELLTPPEGDGKEKVKSKLTKASKKAEFGLKKQIFKMIVNRNLSGFKLEVQELSKELGQRAVVLSDHKPVMSNELHLDLCRLARRLEDDADAKWKEILANHEGRKESRQSFHLSFMQFAISFADFAKNTRLKPLIEKLVKYDYEAERKKLRKRYEELKVGSSLEHMAEEDKKEKFAPEEVADQMQELEEEYLAPPPAANAPTLANRPQRAQPAPEESPPVAPPSPARPQIGRPPSATPPPPPPVPASPPPAPPKAAPPPPPVPELDELPVPPAREPAPETPEFSLPSPPGRGSLADRRIGKPNEPTQPAQGRPLPPPPRNVPELDLELDLPAPRGRAPEPELAPPPPLTPPPPPVPPPPPTNRPLDGQRMRSAFPTPPPRRELPPLDE